MLGFLTNLKTEHLFVLLIRTISEEACCNYILIMNKLFDESLLIASGYLELRLIKWQVKPFRAKNNDFCVFKKSSKSFGAEMFIKWVRTKFRKTQTIIIIHLLCINYINFKVICLIKTITLENIFEWTKILLSRHVLCHKIKLIKCYHFFLVCVHAVSVWWGTKLSF